jgi:hypothetical protein
MIGVACALQFGIFRAHQRRTTVDSPGTREQFQPVIFSRNRVQPGPSRLDTRTVFRRDRWTAARPQFK